MTSFEKYDVLGVSVSVVSLQSLYAAIAEWAGDEIGRFVCMRDTASLSLAANDKLLTDAHNSAAAIAPDGFPVAKIGRLKGFDVSRTSGPDLLPYVMDNGRALGLKHYLYGGNVGVAEKLKKKMEEAFPGVLIVGTACPPFRPLTEAEEHDVNLDIINSDVDIVWVGISSPKQEYWMNQHFQALPCTLIGVGAAFDFLSGQKKRAPVWMRKTGLEWAFRFATEPRRLWRRYFVLVPSFLLRFIISELRRSYGR